MDGSGAVSENWYNEGCEAVYLFRRIDVIQKCPIVYKEKLAEYKPMKLNMYLIHEKIIPMKI